jgi:hypothetical protein
MLNKIAELEKLPLDKTRGFQIILDEAQATVNAKEWNNKEVLNFSKDMTMIRSSRLSIVLTMPTHRMITTDLRQLGIYQVEMYPAETMDLRHKISFSKIHNLKLNPHTGEIWRYRPLIAFRFENPITGLKTVKRGRLSKIAWRLPSKTVYKNYEAMKKAFKEQRSEANAKVTVRQEKKSIFKSMVETIRADPITYQKPDGRLSWYLVMNRFNCGLDTAKKVISFLNHDGV